MAARGAPRADEVGLVAGRGGDVGPRRHRLGAHPGPVDLADDREVGGRERARASRPDGGGSTGAARDGCRAGAGRVGVSTRCARPSVSAGHGAVDGDRAAAERLRDGRDGERAGAGEADDVGAAYVVGDAQLEHLRLVAETLDPVGVRAAGAAPGCSRRTSPASCGTPPARRLRRTARSRSSAQVRRVAACRSVANLRTQVPRPRGSAKRVAWHTVLIPVPGGVVRGADQAPDWRRERAAAPAARLEQHHVGHRPGAGLRRTRRGRVLRTPPCTTNRPPSDVRREQHGGPADQCAAAGVAGRCGAITAGAGRAAASAIGASDSMRALHVRSARCRCSSQKDVGRPCQALLDAAGSRRARARCRRSTGPPGGSSRSTLRCWSGRWCRASRTLFCSA